MNTAILLAGGKGTRLKKKKNKALVLLNKKEMIYYSLKIFQTHKQIDKIIIVSAKKDIAAIQIFLDKYRFSKVVAIVQGGKIRQESAFNGLKFVGVDHNQDIILFHNVANPFVSVREISQLIAAAKKNGAAVVGTKVKSTIKKVDKNNFVVETVSRENLVAVQTPQAIKFSLAWQAFNKAVADKFLGTDDVSLVERLGRRVKVVPCSERNFKITTREDLERAECLTKKQ